MQFGEFGPGDGEHFGGAVEFHGAGAKGDHGGGEGEVLGLEAGDVAKHFMFGVVGVEDGVGEEGGGAAKPA